MIKVVRSGRLHRHHPRLILSDPLLHLLINQVTRIKHYCHILNMEEKVTSKREISRFYLFFSFCLFVCSTISWGCFILFFFSFESKSKECCTVLFSSSVLNGTLWFLRFILIRNSWKDSSSLNSSVDLVEQNKSAPLTRKEKKKTEHGNNF